MKQEIILIRNKSNELMNKNHKNVGRILNYNEHFVILISTVTRFVFISAFASLAGVWVGIVNSAMGLKNLCNNCRN